MHGQRNIAAKKRQMLASIARASDIFRPCCIAFRAVGGKVNTLDYTTIDMGHGMTLRQVLGPQGQLRVAPQTTGPHIIVDAAGQQIKDFTMDTVLARLFGQGNTQCADVTGEGSCRNMRVFAFDEITTDVAGYGTFDGHTSYLDLSTVAGMGSTLAHELGHNLGLEHHGEDNNVMDESTVLPNQIGRDELTGRLEVTEEQCTAARTAATREARPYCHEEQEGPCPETVYDRARACFAAADAALAEELRRIDAACDAEAAALRARIAALTARINRGEAQMKRLGILTDEEIAEKQEKRAEHQAAYDVLKAAAAADLERYRLALIAGNVPADLKPLLPLATCVRRRMPGQRRDRFPAVPGSAAAVDSCFDSLSKGDVRTRSAYFAQPKKLQTDIKAIDRELRLDGIKRRRYRRLIEAVAALKAQRTQLEADLRALEARCERERAAARRRHRDAVAACVRRYARETSGVLGSELLTLILGADTV